MSLNTELAARFKTMATILELKGASGFKVNANAKVADVLEQLVEDISTIEDLTSIAGIGKSSAAKITGYIETGEMPDYDALCQSIPEGLLDVLKVQGLGPKTVKRLWEEAGVVDLESLQAAIDDGRLLALPRMGAKTIENIKDSLTFINASLDRINIGKAMPVAEACVALLSTVDGVTKCQFAGSLRRGQETIGDIDILLSTTNPKAVTTAFCTMDDVTKVLAQGETKCSVRTDKGIQIDLRVIDESQYGAALLYFTGSKAHNVVLRERAIKQGMRLNEYGLFQDDSKSKTPPQERGVPAIASGDESSIYKSLQLEWIPPEIREHFGECDAAIPTLIEIEDIKSDLHCHTDASDGKMTLETLVKQGILRGYHTIAVTDHSQSSTQANGLKPDRLKKTHQSNQADKRTV